MGEKISEKTFRPKGFGFILTISIMGVFIAIGLMLLIVGIVTSDNLYVGLAILYIVFFGCLFALPLINLLSYRIKITTNYISAPTIKPKLYKNNNIIFKRYGKNVETIFFEDVKKADIEYELVYRTSYIFFIFVCKDESVKKIDLKLFSKKQAQGIRDILGKRQIMFEEKEL